MLHIDLYREDWMRVPVSANRSTAIQFDRISPILYDKISICHGNLRSSSYLSIKTLLSAAQVSILVLKDQYMSLKRDQKNLRRHKYRSWALYEMA